MSAFENFWSKLVAFSQWLHERIKNRVIWAGLIEKITNLLFNFLNFGLQIFWVHVAPEKKITWVMIQLYFSLFF